MIAFAFNMILFSLVMSATKWSIIEHVLPMLITHKIISLLLSYMSFDSSNITVYFSKQLKYIYTC